MASAPRAAAGVRTGCLGGREDGHDPTLRQAGSGQGNGFQECKRAADHSPVAITVLTRVPVGTLKLPPVSIPRPAFAAAWMLVAAEAAALLGLNRGWSIGVVSVSPLVFACPLALVIAQLAMRDGRPALSREICSARLPFIALLAGLAGPVLAWGAAAPRLSAWDALGLAIAAAFEETVFRLALPVCVWQLARVLGLPGASPALAAATAVATFAVMPGHVAQMTSPAALLPFTCLALLLLGIVWIGRDPLLAVVVHLGVNAWTLAATYGAVPAVAGRLGTAVIVVPVGIGLARRTRPDPGHRPQASR